MPKNELTGPDPEELDNDKVEDPFPPNPQEIDPDEMVHSILKKQEPEENEIIDPDEAVHKDHIPPPSFEGEKDIDDLMH